MSYEELRKSALSSNLFQTTPRQSSIYNKQADAVYRSQVIRPDPRQSVILDDYVGPRGTLGEKSSVLMGNQRLQRQDPDTVLRQTMIKDIQSAIQSTAHQKELMNESLQNQVRQLQMQLKAKTDENRQLRVQYQLKSNELEKALAENDDLCAKIADYQVQLNKLNDIELLHSQLNSKTQLVLQLEQQLKEKTRDDNNNLIKEMSEQLSKEQTQRLALQNSTVDKSSYYQAMENNRIFQSQIE